LLYFLQRAVGILEETELNLLPSKALVVDIIYAPQQTKLLKLAKTCGLATLNGLGMLAGQAILTQEFWFGKKLNYQTAKDILFNGL